MLHATTRRNVLYALALSAAVHAGAAGLVASRAGAPPGGGAGMSSGPDVPYLSARLVRDGEDEAALRLAAREPASSAPGPQASGSRDDDGARRAAPGAYYHTASELDERPRPITAIALDDAGRGIAQGYLILRLLIDERGRVDEVEVMLNDAPSELVRDARAAFGEARYAPGMKNGRAVKSQMMIEVSLEQPPL